MQVSLTELARQWEYAMTGMNSKLALRIGLSVLALITAVIVFLTQMMKRDGESLKPTPLPPIVFQNNQNVTIPMPPPLQNPPAPAVILPAIPVTPTPTSPARAAEPAVQPAEQRPAQPQEQSAAGPGKSSTSTPLSSNESAPAEQRGAISAPTIDPVIQQQLFSELKRFKTQMRQMVAGLPEDYTNRQNPVPINLKMHPWVQSLPTYERYEPYFNSDGKPLKASLSLKEAGVICRHFVEELGNYGKLNQWFRTGTQVSQYKFGGTNEVRRMCQPLTR
jgi:hypothetical protein